MTQSASRANWFDSNTQTPLIDQYARQLVTFVDALSDGKIDEQELKTQEMRVVDLMKAIEPHLTDELHDKVTRLLCEITAYDLMQMLHEMQQTRIKQFRG